MQAEAVSAAFQVFRRANLKAGEGQYYTPARIVRAAVKLIDIQPDDKIIEAFNPTWIQNGGTLVLAA